MNRNQDREYQYNKTKREMKCKQQVEWMWNEMKQQCKWKWKSNTKQSKEKNRDVGREGWQLKNKIKLFVMYIWDYEYVYTENKKTNNREKVKTIEKRDRRTNREFREKENGFDFFKIE